MAVAGALGRLGLRSQPHPPATLHALLTIALWPEGDRWLSECIELGVGSFGATPNEAYEEGVDAICSYLNTLEQLGERERVFAEKSVTTYIDKPAELHLAHVPRAIADRPEMQLRPYETPPLVFA